jgi:hypothetical protein
MIYQLIDLINPSNYENETEFWQKVFLKKKPLILQFVKNRLKTKLLTIKIF